MQNFVESEGDYTHKAIDARSGTFGVDGTRMTVGILSDSLDNGSNALSEAIAEGNIDPNNTFSITGQEGSGEGELPCNVRDCSRSGPGSNDLVRDRGRQRSSNGFQYHRAGGGRL